MRRLTELPKCLTDAKRAAEIIELDAKSIADTMKAIHGGKWRIQIDHKARFVLVVPELAKKQSAGRARS